jgi:hypothetical protein
MSPTCVKWARSRRQDCYSAELVRGYVLGNLQALLEAGAIPEQHEALRPALDALMKNLASGGVDDADGTEMKFIFRDLGFLRRSELLPQELWQFAGSGLLKHSAGMQDKTEREKESREGRSRSVANNLALLSYFLQHGRIEESHGWQTFSAFWNACIRKPSLSEAAQLLRTGYEVYKSWNRLWPAKGEQIQSSPLGDKRDLLDQLVRLGTSSGAAIENATPTQRRFEVRRLCQTLHILCGRLGRRWEERKSIEAFLSKTAVSKLIELVRAEQSAERYDVTALEMALAQRYAKDVDLKPKVALWSEERCIAFAAKCARNLDHDPQLVQRQSREGALAVAEIYSNGRLVLVKDKDHKRVPVSEPKAFGAKFEAQVQWRSISAFKALFGDAIAAPICGIQ